MTKQKANVPKWGEVWFNKNGITNIFSLASMIKRHRVTFDSDKEAAFLVHTPEGVIKFIMSPEGLFYHALNYCTATQLTQTVAENESSTLINRKNEPREPVNHFTRWRVQLWKI